MDTYNHEPIDKLQDHWENQNKYKHDKHCTYQWNLFSQFFLSVDGMLGKEDLFILTNLSRIMAEKLKEPILQVCGWVNGRISIMVVMSYSHMIF